MKKRKIVWILISALVVWLLVGLADFVRVTGNFEKPMFCVATETADDGGSGRYVGLGYSFEIEGNFMPEDEFPGVTRYVAKIFGFTVMSEVRD